MLVSAFDLTRPTFRRGKIFSANEIIVTRQYADLCNFRTVNGSCNILAINNRLYVDLYRSL